MMDQNDFLEALPSGGRSISCIFQHISHLNNQIYLKFSQKMDTEITLTKLHQSNVI